MAPQPQYAANAAMTNDAKAIDKLLKKKCPDVNAVVDHQEGNTLLHIAAKNGSMDVMAKLYLAGANASIINKKGKTAQELLAPHQRAELAALHGASGMIRRIPGDMSSKYCAAIAAMKLDTGAQIPGCPDLAPADCMLVYQRLGLATVLQKRLQQFRLRVGVHCDNFTVLDACNDAVEVTVTALKALLAGTPADDASFATSTPVKAVQELLEGGDKLAAIIAIAGTAGIYPCSNNRDLGRKNLRCKQFRTVLLMVSQTLAAWMALPNGESSRRLCKATRKEFTKALNLQLEHTENLLCLTTEGGWAEPMDMLTVAADACCNQEGAAARKLLLPKAEMKQVLAQCFALTAAHCTSNGPNSPKPHKDVHRFAASLARFLSDGVGSASLSDPRDMAAVCQLLCPDIVAHSLVTLQRFTKRCEELKQIVAEDKASPAKADIKLGKGATQVPRPDRIAAMHAPAPAVAPSPKALGTAEAVDALAAVGSATADLVCALMGCSRVSPELHTALLYEGRVLDCIEATTFTTDQATKWMQFLAAAVSPDPLEATLVDRLVWRQAAVTLCDEIRSRLSKGKLKLLVMFPGLNCRVPGTAVEYQKAEMLLADALARNIPQWILFHFSGPKSLLGDKQLRSMLLSASQAFEAGLASPDEDERQQHEAARRRFTQALNAQLQQTERLICLKSEDGWAEPMQMLMVAADACWDVEGAPARKLLLPNQQLKLILEQCLAVISVQCGSGLPLSAKPQEKVYRFSSGLARFLSDGVASASPSDPVEMAGVKRLLCADTVARCVTTMDKFVKRCKELKDIIAGWNVYQAAHQQETPSSAIKEGLSSKQAAKAANKAAASQAEYEAKQLKAEKAAADLELFSKTSADLACALMDCSRVSPELHTALVTEAKVLDYIESSTFTPAQATKWMQFLAAVVAPYSSEAKAVGRMMWCQASAKICHQIHARLLQGRLEVLVTFPVECYVSAELADPKRAAMQMLDALSLNVPGWRQSAAVVALSRYESSTGLEDRRFWEEVLRDALEACCMSVRENRAELDLQPPASPLHVAMRVVHFQCNLLHRSSDPLQPATAVEALHLLLASLRHLPKAVPTPQQAYVDEAAILAAFALLIHTASVCAAHVACQVLHEMQRLPGSRSAWAAACCKVPAREVYDKLVAICSGRGSKPAGDGASDATAAHTAAGQLSSGSTAAGPRSSDAGAGEGCEQPLEALCVLREVLTARVAAGVVRMEELLLLRSKLGGVEKVVSEWPGPGGWRTLHEVYGMVLKHLFPVQSPLPGMQEAESDTRTVGLHSRQSDPPRTALELPPAQADPLLPEAGPVMPEPDVLPAQANPLPAQTNPLPAEANPLPAQANPLPVEANPLPAQANPLPAEANFLPAQVDALPDQTPALPAQGTALPAQAAALPAKADPWPAQVVHLPAKADTLPSQADHLPAKAEHRPAQAGHQPAQQVVPAMPEPERLQAHVAVVPDDAAVARVGSGAQGIGMEAGSARAGGEAADGAGGRLLKSWRSWWQGGERPDPV